MILRRGDVAGIISAIGNHGIRTMIVIDAFQNIRALENEVRCATYFITLSNLTTMIVFMKNYHYESVFS